MKLKILLVEDDKMLCTIFSMFIKQLGHELVGIFHDAETALEKSEDLKPDLAVFDIHIGGQLNGIEAANILQEKLSTPIIFLSGDTQKDTLQKANEVKCKVFLGKPVYKSTLNIGIEIALLKNCNTRFDLSQKNNEIDQLINSISEPIILIQNDKIIRINEKAENYFALENKTELIGKSIFEIITHKKTKEFKTVYNKLSAHKLLLEYFRTSLKVKEKHYDTGATFSFIQDSKEDIAILCIDTKK